MISGIPSISNRRLIIILIGLASLVGAGYRFTFIYPSSPLYTQTIDPVFIGIQAFDILQGERPLFFPGQDFMGAFGSYFIAFLYKFMGASTFTLGLSAWFWGVLWYLLVIVMCLRFFGPFSALLAALLWTIPTDLQLYWGREARPDYQLSFISVPLLFIITHNIVGNIQNHRPVKLLLLTLGLFSGLSYWNNMITGPAIFVCFLTLLIQIKRRLLNFFILGSGFFLGYFPVFFHKCTNSSSFSWNPLNWNQVCNLPQAAAAFLKNSFPALWGFTPPFPSSSFFLSPEKIFLFWTGFLGICFILRICVLWKRTIKIWDSLLLLSYLFTHFMVLALTDFSSRFYSTDPLSATTYLSPLFSVALVIPCAVISSFKSIVWRIVFILPFGIFLMNNFNETKGYPKVFIQSFKNKIPSGITSFPSGKDELISFLKEKGLKNGYIGNVIHQSLNMQGLGQAGFSDFYQEKRLRTALQSDSEKNLFWISHIENLDKDFQRLGSEYINKTIKGYSVFYDFKREIQEESLIEDITVSASKKGKDIQSALDRKVNTEWVVTPSEIDPQTTILFQFKAPEKLSRLVLIPSDHAWIPQSFSVEVSQDGKEWTAQMEVEDAKTFFWSVYHPFWKVVKPRMEISLPSEKPVKYLRMVINGEKQNFPISIREFYIYRHKGEGLHLKTQWEKETRLLLNKILKIPKQNICIVADHWFESFFRLADFEVEFIPNQSVSDTGKKNPHWNQLIPLDFSKKIIFLSSAPHRSGIEKRLKTEGIPFQREDFRFYTLFYTLPAAPAESLYWNGIDLTL